MVTRYSRSRIMLRAPLLLSGDYWLSSVCICVRAAQMLLCTYLRILRPGLRVLANTALPAVGDQLKRELLEATSVPSTWRQVRRITTSALVVFYAFWRGEASHDEAGEAAATAALLLEFERTRWGSAIDEARKTIRDLSNLSGLDMYHYLEKILHKDGDEYLAIVLNRILESEQPHQENPQNAAAGSTINTEAQMYQPWDSTAAWVFLDWNLDMADFGDYLPQQY